VVLPPERCAPSGFGIVVDDVKCDVDVLRCTIAACDKENQSNSLRSPFIIGCSEIAQLIGISCDVLMSTQINHIMQETRTTCCRLIADALLCSNNVATANCFHRHVSELQKSVPSINVNASENH
jgi:hypothetical protein